MYGPSAIDEVEEQLLHRKYIYKKRVKTKISRRPGSFFLHSKQTPKRLGCCCVHKTTAAARPPLPLPHAAADLLSVPPGRACLVPPLMTTLVTTTPITVVGSEVRLNHEHTISCAQRGHLRSSTAAAAGGHRRGGPREASDCARLVGHHPTGAQLERHPEKDG